MRYPQIKSDKQFVRLWYEFFRLGLRLPDLREAIESRNHYDAWGDGSAPFDEWWKTHRQLFDLGKVERVRSGNERPGLMLVQIPISLPLAESAAEVRRLIKEAQAEELRAIGLDPKAVKSGGIRLGRAELAGKEPRGRNLYEALIVFGHWVDLGQPPINNAFAVSLHAKLGLRKRSRWLPQVLVPATYENGSPVYDADRIRQIRRLKDRGMKAAQAVSVGAPPRY